MIQASNITLRLGKRALFEDGWMDFEQTDGSVNGWMDGEKK